MIHANFTALCVIEAELLLSKVLHCGNGIVVMLRLSNKRSKSNFCWKSNWIKIDFFAGIISILTHGWAKTMHCSELLRAKYAADLITRIACHGGRAVRLLQ